MLNFGIISIRWIKINLQMCIYFTRIVWHDLIICVHTMNNTATIKMCIRFWTSNALTIHQWKISRCVRWDIFFFVHRLFYMHASLFSFSIQKLSQINEWGRSQIVFTLKWLKEIYIIMQAIKQMFRYYI